MQVDAQPYSFSFDPATTALVIIDMQRDFVEPDGFGETLGNDVSYLQAVVPPLKKVLEAARDVGLTVIHTREGHVPDLSDCPPAKLNRGEPSLRIGDPGPKGRILIRGEYGHDIIDDLQPVAGELVIESASGEDAVKLAGRLPAPITVTSVPGRFFFIWTGT